VGRGCVRVAFKFLIRPGVVVLSPPTSGPFLFLQPTQQPSDAYDATLRGFPSKLSEISRSRWPLPAHAMASRTMPPATATADAMRSFQGRSPNHTMPMSAAITTLVSRMADTLPSVVRLLA
jgi:hypothetical protein